MGTIVDTSKVIMLQSTFVMTFRLTHNRFKQILPSMYYSNNSHLSCKYSILKNKDTSPSYRYYYDNKPQMFHSNAIMKVAAEQSNNNMDDEILDVRPPSDEFINSLDPDQQRKLTLIRLEIDSKLSTGHMIPYDITDEKYKFLLSECPSFNSRMKQLRFWKMNEDKSKKDKLKKSEGHRKHLERIEEFRRMKEAGIEQPSRIMFRIVDATMEKHYNGNLCHAMLQGLPLIIDLGFHDNTETHNRQACKNVLEQCTLMFGFNKVSRDPFHLVFCNTVVDTWTPYHQGFKMYIERDHVPITMTEKSYLELYPKNELVYLTPDSPNELEYFDANKKYIIGGIVDKKMILPLTYAKAKKEGIATCKLPLDRHVIGGVNMAKPLTINQMFNILLHMKDSPYDWQKAFETWVPKRRTKIGQQEKHNRIMAQRLMYMHS